MTPALTAADLDRIAAALGRATHVPYAPPHVYPMAAPAFAAAPLAERDRPAGDRLGVYVHVPFCNYSCSFCFYARRIGDTLDVMERYARAVCRELEWIDPGTKLTQLYVGGGTPTALPPDLLDAVLAKVFERVVRDGDLIHTVECSPETATPEHLAVLDAHAIGRVSMGIQSLDPAVLDAVNRGHNADAALAAVDRLVASGRVVNVDLIYGLPGQTEDGFRRDFAAVAARGVHSVTAYNLRVNERTAVARDLAAAEHLDLPRLVRWRGIVQQTAEETGFVRKTWHTFERPTGIGTLYVDRTGAGDQIGVGASARSRLGHTVYRNIAATPGYVERVEAGRSPVEEVFRLGEEDRMIRYVGQTLGVGKPLSRAAYREAFSRDFEDDFGEPLRRTAAAGLVDDDGERVQLSPTGRVVYDLVTLAYYPRRVQDWLEDRHAKAVRKHLL